MQIGAFLSELETKGIGVQFVEPNTACGVHLIHRDFM